MSRQTCTSIRIWEADGQDLDTFEYLDIENHAICKTSMVILRYKDGSSVTVSKADLLAAVQNATNYTSVD